MSGILCCLGRSKNVESKFDPRFGATNITSPNPGAYINPNAKDDGIKLQQPAMTYFPGQGNFNKKSPSSRPSSSGTVFSTGSSASLKSPAPWEKLAAKKIAKVEVPLPTRAVSPLPVHHAYASSSPHYSGSSLSPSASGSTKVGTPPASSPKANLSPRLKLSSSLIQKQKPEERPGAVSPVAGGSRVAQQQQHSRPPVRLEPVPKKALRQCADSPNSTHSVEQWPGSM